MKVQFWGLSKTRINKIINKIELEFQRKLNNIEYELERVQKENRNLRIKLDNDSKKNSVLNEDKVFWNLAQERLEKVISYFSQQTESEMSLLRKMYAEKNSEITHEINKLNLEREAIEHSFSQMLNQIAVIVEQSKEVALKLDVINKQSNETDGFPIEEMESSDLVSSSIELLLDSTNDDETMEEVDDVSFLANSEVIADQVKNELTITRENLTSMNDKDDHHAHYQDSFWGNLEGWTETNHELRNGLFDNHDMLTSIDTEFSENIMEQTGTTSTDHLEKEQVVNKNGISKEEHSVENEIINDDLIEQIDAIKSQYIVGKMTGEDLLDANGKLIISKNTLITREVVETANQAGKLAELIVNMKLSGLGDG